MIKYKEFIETYFRIKNKKGEIVPFVFNSVQNLYYEQLKKDYEGFEGIRDNICKARREGFCLDPKTRVLTADLNWVTLNKIKPGQKIVAVDEFSPGGRGKSRKMKVAVVEGKREINKKAFLLKMENGQELVATAEHKFLIRTQNSTKAMWRAVKDPRLRFSIVGCYIRYITKPWKRQTLEDAWFGGFLDGDGSMRAKKSGGAEVMGCQRKGVVWDRILNYAKSTGFSYREEWDRRKHSKDNYNRQPLGRVVFNRMNELFELIGKTRSTRFIDRHWWVGKDFPGRRSGKAWSRVISIKPLGVRKMIDLQTSTKTFIAEGFVSHNSALWEAIFTTDFILGSIGLAPIISGQVISHKLEEVKPHFQRISMFLDSYLDIKKVRRKDFLEVDNKTSYIKAKTGPELFVGSAGSKVLGRGGETQNLLWTEVAFYPNTPIINAEDLVTGAEQQVPMGRGKIVRESTGNVVGDFFYEEWYRGKGEWGENESPFYSRFFPWFIFKEYRVSCPPGFKFLPTEIELRKLYHLDSNQLYWYHLKMKGFKDKNKGRREYPSSPMDSFLSAGSCFFDLPTLKWYLSKTKKPIKEGLLTPGGEFI